MCKHMISHFLDYDAMPDENERRGCLMALRQFDSGPPGKADTHAER
ncbi:hypothetical protein ABIE67_008315 [Streptomyces sp. V4I8]